LNPNDGANPLNKPWNRREVVTASAKLAAALALSSLSRRSVAAMQLPPREPMPDPRIAFVTTTESSPWQRGAILKPTFQWDMLNLNIDPNRASEKGIQGFGGCFNELGWTSLSMLADQDRESILRELFHPIDGARFTYCRMPIAANDYATEAYSYDETDGDFDLKHFTIDHDRKTLIVSSRKRFP
jgi:glucosylceramidase